MDHRARSKSDRGLDQQSEAFAAKAAGANHRIRRSESHRGVEAMAPSMSARKTARPVALYLDEFGPTPLAAISFGEASQDAANLDLTEEEVVQIPSVLLLAAREEGIGEGRAAASAEYETHIARER